MTLKTGVIGYGFSAKVFHLPFLEAMSQFEFSAISTSKAPDSYLTDRNVTVYSSADRLIDDSDVELVIITAPNDSHFRLAERCLNNNKHVIVEKPFVITSDQGATLSALAKAKNLKLSVYQNRRWDGDFLTLQNLIQTDACGDIKYFESHFDRFRPLVQDRWREKPVEGGGILYDLGPHLIDQVMVLFGTPQAITARCLNLRENAEVTDYFHIQLHYQGLEVVLQASPYSAGPNLRFQLQGTKGSYVKYGLDPQEDRLKAGKLPVTPEWSQETPDAFGTIYHSETESPVHTLPGGYQIFYEKMYHAIRNNQPVPVDPEQNTVVIKLIELALESSHRGQTLIFEM